MMRRARYWRSAPSATYRRSRLPSATGCIRRPYVEDAGFDELRHQLKQDRLDVAEALFGRR